MTDVHRIRRPSLGRSQMSLISDPFMSPDRYCSRWNSMAGTATPWTSTMSGPMTVVFVVAWFGPLASVHVPVVTVPGVSTSGRMSTPLQLNSCSSD